MAKITVEGQVYEGTPEELREIFEMFGVKFPAEEVEGEKIDSARPTIGDFVKVINKETSHRANEGDYLKVIRDSEDYQPYECNDLNGNSVGWLRESEVVKATEEEVAQAKAELERKQAEKELEEKWAKIGRKPNEFKKGDIVRLNTHSGAHDIGTIVFVSDEEYGNYYDGKGEFWGGEFSWYELVAPVESRFDKDSE